MVKKSPSHTTSRTRWPTPPLKKYLAPGLKWSLQEERQKAQERSDTIIMQLTQQLEQQTLLLEDLRHRSIWERIKAVFAPANAGV